MYSKGTLLKMAKDLRSMLEDYSKDVASIVEGDHLNLFEDPEWIKVTSNDIEEDLWKLTLAMDDLVKAIKHAKVKKEYRDKFNGGPTGEEGSEE